MSARILVMEDDASLRELLSEELTDAGYQVDAVGALAAAQRHLQQEIPELVISDLRLPDGEGMTLLPDLKARDELALFIIITAFGTVDQAVDALRAGADEFITKPLSIDHLLFTVKRLLAFRETSLALRRYRSHDGDEDFYGLMGRSGSMLQLFNQVRQVGRSEAALLIQGESGVGKELVARAVHAESQRADGPFMAVNCAGIPAELMESEFFGHAAGAFTGAKRARAGLFVEAEGGTLLLDEVAEMPLSLQAKLLRVLQEQRVKPVGADQEQPVNVRVLAATHRELQQRVEEGSFREDLYYRLEALTLQVPPLRDRDDDVELLAARFLDDATTRQRRPPLRLSEDSLAILRRYPFPGNVRELSNAMERATTFCEGTVVEPHHLPERIRRGAGADDTVQEDPPALTPEDLPSLYEVQRQHVHHVLSAVDGNKRRAAQILGIHRRTLYRWLEELDQGREPRAGGRGEEQG